MPSSRACRGVVPCYCRTSPRSFASSANGVLSALAYHRRCRGCWEAHLQRLPEAAPGYAAPRRTSTSTPSHGCKSVQAETWAPAFEPPRRQERLSQWPTTDVGIFALPSITLDGAMPIATGRARTVPSRAQKSSDSTPGRLGGLTRPSSALQLRHRHPGDQSNGLPQPLVQHQPLVRRLEPRLPTWRRAPARTV
jgi:hypothetical protein